MVDTESQGQSESLSFKVTDGSVLGLPRTGLVHLLKGLRGNLGKREGTTSSVSAGHQEALSLSTQFTDEEIEAQDK